MLQKPFQLLSSILAFALLLGTPTARAQTDSNPLDPTPDPLLPQSTTERPLSPLERLRLKNATLELHQQATEQLEAGADQAFAIWYRELRLQRALGRLPEIQALGRVGSIAWEQNRPTDVQLITGRLEAIEQEAEAEAALEPILKELGQAYQQVRSPNQAAAIYQRILANAREQQDPATEEAALETLGQLHLARFDYSQAAAVYEELLAKAQAKSDFLREGNYLRQLATLYTEALQPENALEIKQQLAERYYNEQQGQLPALKIAIAADYEALNQLEAASQNYQEAFTLAWSLRQLATAKEALQKLGDLYQTSDRPNYALQIYQELLKVEQHAYDFYGLMNTYDRIGKIHQEQNNYAQAIAAYRQALEIAIELSYQEDYFISQIEQIQEIVQ